MKRKMVILSGILVCTLFLYGCSVKNDVEKQKDNAKKNLKVETYEEEDIAAMDEKTSSYPEKDAGSILYKSPLGYTCKFDPTVFTLDDTKGEDHFNYLTNEKLDSPVYISVQKRTDFSEKELIDGIILQSGDDKVEAQETKFGALGIDAKNISIQKNVNGVKQMQTFYTVPVEKGILLIEMGGYVGMPETCDHKLEEITGTFQLE